MTAKALQDGLADTTIVEHCSTVQCSFCKQSSHRKNPKSSELVLRFTFTTTISITKNFPKSRLTSVN